MTSKSGQELLAIAKIGDRGSRTTSSTKSTGWVLAAHYRFTDEELDFIPSTKLRTSIPSSRLKVGNYGITYRMGREAENEKV